MIHPTTTPALPSGSWRLLLADPPWQYSFSANSANSPARHYPVMPTAAIAALPVATIAASASCLLLWVPSPKLPDGLAVMNGWGFTYKTSAIWHKSGNGMGYYWRQNAEYVLLGTRGPGLGAPHPSTRISSVMPAPKTGHSRKPDMLHDLVERWWPGLGQGDRLELFARRAERPEKWTYWGNEL